jgi:L-cysteine S-thiosulfotransferase
MTRLLLAAATLATLAAAAFAEDRRSGFTFMSPATQAMQRDDMSNPGMFAVAEGIALWSEPDGEAAVSCADCHGEPGDAMKGVAARYPAIDNSSGEPLDIEGRINVCRTRHQRAEPLRRETRPLIALAAVVGHQSRGMAVSPDLNPRMDALRAEGREIWGRRLGQLNLSCANCHDDNWGGRLAGSLIPQAHPTGYPIYRLEWQDMGSLQRRLRGCLVGVRAAPLVPGSREAVALEAYLMERAAGLEIETPAVRP